MTVRMSLAKNASSAISVIALTGASLMYSLRALLTPIAPALGKEDCSSDFFRSERGWGLQAPADFVNSFHISLLSDESTILTGEERARTLSFKSCRSLLVKELGHMDQAQS